MNSINEITPLFEIGKKPKIFDVRFAVLRPITLEITIADPMRPNTAYTVWEEKFDRPDNNFRLEMKVPVTPEVLLFSMKINQQDGIEKYIKPKNLIIKDYSVPVPNFSPQTNAFFHFITWFCERAGYLTAGMPPSGTTYTNKIVDPNSSFHFEMEYVDILTDEHGNEHPTPARIHTVKKFIQNSAKLMRPKPIARRLGINWHEYSHEFKNLNPNSESEADFNGSFFFDQTGWNDWDYVDSFVKTFEKASQHVNLNNAATYQNHLVQKRREQAIIDKYRRKNFLKNR